MHASKLQALHDDQAGQATPVVDCDTDGVWPVVELARAAVVTVLLVAGLVEVVTASDVTVPVALPVGCMVAAFVDITAFVVATLAVMETAVMLEVTVVSEVLAF